MKINEIITESQLDERIHKVSGGYRLLSRKGKNLGTFPTKAAAEKHEREVQYFKHDDEGSDRLNEFSPGGNFKPQATPKNKGDGPWEDDNRSKILRSVRQLLKADNKVDWRVPGQMGHVVSVRDDGIIMRRLNKPYSKMRFVLPMYDDSRDSQYTIKMVAPKHYMVVSVDTMDEDSPDGMSPNTKMFI